MEMYVMFHEFYGFCQRCMSSFIPFADRYFIALFREIPQEHSRDIGISEGTKNKLNTRPLKVILLKHLCKRSMDSLLGLVARRPSVPWPLCEYTLLFIPGATMGQNNHEVLPGERECQPQPDKFIPKLVRVL